MIGLGSDKKKATNICRRINRKLFNVSYSVEAFTIESGERRGQMVLGLVSSLCLQACQSYI